MTEPYLYYVSPKTMYGLAWLVFPFTLLQYGEANRVCSEIFDKLKDVIVISNLAKATETAINISSQAILGRFSISGDIGEPEARPPALPQTSTKRKKYAKVNKGNWNLQASSMLWLNCMWGKFWRYLCMLSI